MRAGWNLDGGIEVALANPTPGSHNVADDGYGNALGSSRHEDFGH